jgi:two-component system, NtrC family, sensor kinase
MKLILSRPDRWLALLIAASLILPPIFFGLIAYQSRATTLAAADEQLVGTARLLREHAEKVLETDELVIQQVDQLIAGMSWDDITVSEALHQKLKQLDEQLAQVRGIFLIAPDGSVANSSRAVPVPPDNFSDREYFAALRAGSPGAFVSRTYRGRITGNQQFDFARRRSSPDGSFDGIINISDSPLYFEKAYQDIGNDAASVVLARDDGEELANYPTPMFSGSRVPADLIAGILQSEPLLVDPIPSPYDATDRRGAYQKLHRYPLFVGYSLPVSSITATWRRTVILNGMLMGIGSLAVAFMGWLVLRAVRRESAAHAAFRAEVQKREQAEAKMEQARKMEAVGQLTAGVAHDFNNLLAIISGNLERLGETAAGDGKKRVEAALSATARGDSLIRKMLTFARRQVLHPEVLDVNAELKSFAPLLASALNPTIALEYQLAAKPMFCRIDRAEFEFAILNIATNAGHAMPRGGRLEINARLVDGIDPGMRWVMNGLDLAPGSYLRIAFMDSGEGMPLDVLARAFEPYFTTRNAGVGTGLGLSQVYGFARQSGGLATIDSTVGHGTTVTMYLPVMAEEALRQDAREMTDVL